MVWVRATDERSFDMSGNFGGQTVNARASPGQHVARHVVPDKARVDVSESCTSSSVTNAMEVLEDLPGPGRRDDDARRAHGDVAQDPDSGRSRKRKELETELGVGVT